MSSKENTAPSTLKPGLLFRLVHLLRECAAIWKSALKTEKQRTILKRQKDELEFLPAALEILETGPSKTSRVTIGLIIAFLLIAILWATFGKVATTAVATGKIIPSGHLKEVQSLEAGIVKQIHVRTGEHVFQGQVLIELDPTESEVDANQVKHNLQYALADYHRLDMTWREFNGGEPGYDFPNEIESPLLVIESRERMLADLENIKAKIKQIDARRDELLARLESLRAEQQMQAKITPFLEEREKAYKDLRNTAVSRENWMSVKRELLEQEKLGVNVRHQIREIDQALVRNQTDREETISAINRQLVQQRSESKLRVDQSRMALRKLEQRQSNAILTSPVDGVIQQMAVHTIGGVVTPAEVLMTIVPESAELEVDAFIANKDIGFVHLNQPVAVKVESFPYTRYGYIDGELSHYGADAIQHEQLGLVFPAKISLQQDAIQVGEKMVKLQPGMQVQADIQTGHRRVISYFLEPLLSYQKESLRER